MFQIGERIMYGSSGVCRVEAIGKPDSASFADRDRDYYTLSPLYGEGVIYVPVDSSVFMRPILSREEALELIRHIPEIPAEPFATRDQRLLSEHYRSFFSRHDCGDLLELIRSIYVKGQTLSRQGKKVGSTDQQYLRRAVDLLHGELAAALDIPVEQVEDFIAGEIGNKINEKNEKE